MRATNEYRIIDDMGKFYAQRKNIGWRHKVMWITEGQWEGDHDSGNWFVRKSFDTIGECKAWIRGQISEHDRKERLFNRGVVVVEEIS